MFAQIDKPQRYFQLFAQGFKLYKRSIYNVLPICAIYFLLLFSANFLDSLDLNIQNKLIPQIFSTALSFIVLLLVAAIIHIQYHYYENEKTNYRKALFHGVKRYLVFLGASVVYMAGVIVGGVLLVIPGLIVLVGASLYSVIIMSEDVSLIKSLKNSFKLVWPFWFRTALELVGYMVIYILFALTIMMVLGFISYIIVFSMSELSVTQPYGIQIAYNFGIVLMCLAPALLMPLPSAFLIVIYKDLLCRHKEREQAQS